jgi:HSP20 family protein
MSWDEDFDRWLRRWRRGTFFDFEHIDKMFDDMFKDMMEDVPKELYREERLPDGSIVRRMGPFVYGHSITIGPDGKPVIREFGNVKPSRRSTAFGATRPSLEVKEEREPLVDVLSDKENVRVIVEVPGVNKKDIRLSCSERMLTISVDSEARKYYRDVELPDEVDPKTAKAKYTNGVLEITLAKVKAKKPTGETIRID